MVYVSGDGTILQSAPWSVDRLTKFFFGAINFVIFFFKSLVGLDSSSASFRSGSSRSGGGSTSSRGSGGGGGGGGGNGGYGPWRPGGGGGGGGPSKRIMTIRDINPPTIGGCPGGACGR